MLYSVLWDIYSSNIKQHKQKKYVNENNYIENAAALKLKQIKYKAKL